MTVEPISVTAPPLARPHLLRQHWCDLTFLHWAVDPAEAVAHRIPPGSGRTSSTASPTSG